MATAWVHRLVVSVPTASLASVGAWWKSHVDAADDLSAWPTLNPTGLMTDPATASWGCMSLTEPLARSIISQVCALSGVTPPTGPQWNGWSKAQKYAWLSGVRANLYAQSGIWLDLADNESDQWDDPQAILDGLGLKVRQAPPGTP